MPLLQKLFHWRPRVLATPARPRFTTLVNGSDGTLLRGTLHLKAAGYFNGEIEGEVRADDELVIEPAGKIRGNLRGAAFSVEGEITGEITADGEVALKEKSRVRGNLSASALAVESGAQFTGVLAIGGDERDLVLNLKLKT